MPTTHIIDHNALKTSMLAKASSEDVAERQSLEQALKALVDMPSENDSCLPEAGATFKVLNTLSMLENPNRVLYPTEFEEGNSIQLAGDPSGDGVDSPAGCKYTRSFALNVYVVMKVTDLDLSDQDNLEAAKEFMAWDGSQQGLLDFLKTHGDKLDLAEFKGNNPGRDASSFLGGHVMDTSENSAAVKSFNEHRKNVTKKVVMDLVAQAGPDKLEGISSLVTELSSEEGAITTDDSIGPIKGVTGVAELTEDMLSTVDVLALKHAACKRVVEIFFDKLLTEQSAQPQEGSNTTAPTPAIVDKQGQLQYMKGFITAKSAGSTERQAAVTALQEKVNTSNCWFADDEKLVLAGALGALLKDFMYSIPDDIGGHIKDAAFNKYFEYQFAQHKPEALANLELANLAASRAYIDSLAEYVGAGTEGENPVAAYTAFKEEGKNDDAKCIFGFKLSEVKEDFTPEQQQRLHKRCSEKLEAIKAEIHQQGSFELDPILGDSLKPDMKMWEACFQPPPSPDETVTASKGLVDAAMKNLARSIRPQPAEATGIAQAAERAQQAAVKLKQDLERLTPQPENDKFAALCEAIDRRITLAENLKEYYAAKADPEVGAATDLLVKVRGAYEKLFKPYSTSAPVEEHKTDEEDKQQTAEMGGDIQFPHDPRKFKSDMEANLGRSIKVDDPKTKDGVTKTEARFTSGDLEGTTLTHESDDNNKTTKLIATGTARHVALALARAFKAELIAQGLLDSSGNIASRRGRENMLDLSDAQIKVKGMKSGSGTSTPEKFRQELEKAFREELGEAYKKDSLNSNSMTAEMTTSSGPSVFNSNKPSDDAPTITPTVTTPL